MKHHIITVLITLSLYAFNFDLKGQKLTNNDTTYVELPNDLSNIPDETFRLLDNWINDSEIIGVSEGEHGMNEGLDFRNSYIKYLVRTNRIQVIALESGLLESRLVNEYINGSDLDIDSVLAHGITYTFGQFEQNRDLLNWLRNTNASRTPNERVHFYGFDMSGNAPNPFLDDASYALREGLRYFQTVDHAFYNEIFPQAEFYFPYLNIPESQETGEKSFTDLTIENKSNLKQLLDKLTRAFQKNRKKYVRKIGREKYDWALQSIVCARQNIEFLEGFLSAEKDQSSRERFMLENLKWIRKQEGNKKILLFAHLAHLAKDISRPDENGKETLPENMFGELLAKEFGGQYKVVANFFNDLDYYDGVDRVDANSFPDILHQIHHAPNFCLKINNNDSLFLKPQTFGISLRGKLWMTPSLAVDVILYTEKQHFHYKNE